MAMRLRGKPAEPARYNAPRPITSAATPVRLRDRSEMEKIRQRSSTAQAWQMEAWRAFKVIGEIHFALTLIADSFSRIRFHAAVAVNPDEPPVEVADGSMIEVGEGREVGARGGVDPRLAVRARDLMAKLQQGHGMATMQRAYALQRQVTGECYLCCIEGNWSIKSTSELVPEPGGGMRLQPSVATTSATPTILDPGTPIYRMWTMDPQYSSDPDCALRSVLYQCEQLIKANRMVSNTIASRMNAGILQVANQIADAAQTPGTEGNISDDPDTTLEKHPFDADVMATMTQPIQDDQAGAAVIPMIVRHDIQHMDGIKWTSLARDLDKDFLAWAENLLDRILNGINIPKNAITGFQNVRYSNAQQITQDTFEQGVEPLALSFADEITSIYLKPMLRADIAQHGWDPEQVEKMVVWYDPSEVVTRPDRGADADAGWDRGALSDDAWRRAHGFSADDAPDETELLMRTMLRSAQLPPNLVDYMARELYPDYFKDAPPLVTQAAAGMSQAATEPLGHAGPPHPHPFHTPGQPDNAAPTRNPANQFRPRVVGGQNDLAASEDGDIPAGGTLPPRPDAR